MSSRFGLSAPRTCFLLAAAIGLVMLASGDAAAGDAKRVPGTICHFANQSVHRASAVKGGGFQNTSGSTQVVICPITKDELGTDIDVFVRVDDTLGNTGCKVSWFDGALTVDEVNPSSVFDFLGVTKDLEFEGVVDASQASYTFAVQCTLPNNSTVYALQWSEG